MKRIVAATGGSLFSGACCTSCMKHTPELRGYARIKPSKAQYKPLDLSYPPFNFDVSQTAVIEVPDQRKDVTGLNISYPELEAKPYCSYLPITPASLVMAGTESRSFVARLMKSENRISEKAHSDPVANVYGSLLLLDGRSASPIRFLPIDSASNFSRGTLYFDYKPNVDSLAPVIQYIREDIIEPMQTFSWKK